MIANRSKTTYRCFNNRGVPLSGYPADSYEALDDRNYCPVCHEQGGLAGRCPACGRQNRKAGHIARGEQAPQREPSPYDLALQARWLASSRWLGKWVVVGEGRR